MTAVKTSPFDPANYLQTKEDILYFLDAAMEGNDAQHIARALGDVVCSQGMRDIAGKAALEPQAFLDTLSENGNPTLETLISVLSALGLQLTVQKRAA